MTTSPGITVGLVGCASQKLQRPAPARELYVSQLFKKTSAYAEATCDRWYILSAKHGLVHPDAVVEPYDMRLGTNDGTSPPIHAWAAGVQEQMAAEFAGLEGVTLVVLAGEQYRTILSVSPWPSEVPMKGLGIGQQLGWLTAQLNALEPASGHRISPKRRAAARLGGVEPRWMRSAAAA